MQRSRTATIGISATLGALAATALLLFTGCSDKAQEVFNDADISGENTAPAEIINMPDGFSNVSSKCDGPNRVYVIYHGNQIYGAIDVVPNDPRCEE